MDKEDIYRFKIYYNRERVIYSIVAILELVPILMTIAEFFNGKRIELLPFVLFLGVSIVTGLFFSGKIHRIETLSVTEVDNIFWFNRHRIEEQAIVESPLMFFLSFWCFLFGLATLMYLSLRLPPVYSAIGMFSVCTGTMLVFLDLFLSFSSKCEIVR